MIWVILYHFFMILLEPLIESIKKELGSNFFTEAHGLSDTYRYINSSVNYIWNYKDWSFSKVTQTVNVVTPMAINTITFVSPVYAVKNGQMLPEILDAEQWFRTLNPVSKVSCYENVFIAPVTGAYEILYRGVAPYVDKTSAAVDLPERFTDVVRIFAIMFAYKDVKKYDRSSALLGEGNAILDKVAERHTINAPSQLLRMGESTNWK